MSLSVMMYRMSSTRYSTTISYSRVVLVVWRFPISADFVCRTFELLITCFSFLKLPQAIRSSRHDDCSSFSATA